VPFFENISAVSALYRLPSSLLLLSLTGLPAITSFARDSSYRAKAVIECSFLLTSTTGRTSGRTRAERARRSGDGQSSGFRRGR